MKKSITQSVAFRPGDIVLDVSLKKLLSKKVRSSSATSPLKKLLITKTVSPIDLPQLVCIWMGLAPVHWT